MPSYITANECRCQNCLQRFRLSNEKIYIVINLDTDGFDKKHFFNSSLNKVRCENCNNEFTFETNMVIFSLSRKFAIYVNPNSKHDSIGCKKTAAWLFPEDFKFREVNYLTEALEKTRIFYDGLSDINIEMLKSKSFSDDDTMPFDEVLTVYENFENDTYHFTKYDCNDKCLGQYTIKNQKQYCREYESNINHNIWVKVNRLTINKLCKGDLQ